MSALPLLKVFIIDNFLFGDNVSWLNEDTSLIESGIVDSTGMLEIILFLESTFGITVEDHEVIPENLDSLKNIAAFLDRKNGHSGVFPRVAAQPAA